MRSVPALYRYGVIGLTTIIDGKALAADVEAETRERAKKLAEKGIVLGLATVMVGENPASQMYIRLKHSACSRVGIRSENVALPDDTTEEQLIWTLGRPIMLNFKSMDTVAVGEAMVELAPVGEGQYQRGFAGDTFNTVWHMAQALHGRAKVSFATRVGQDRISDAFITELVADGLDVSSIGRDPVRIMGLYMIELDGIERSFHYWRDRSAARGLASDPAVLARALSGAGLIHLSGITLAILKPADRQTLIAALAEARANGARVSFDPNIRPRLWSSMDEVRQVIHRFWR